MAFAAARMARALRTGLGVGWHEHDASLFRGTERFFRAGYAAHLIAEWIPALEDGLADRVRFEVATAKDFPGERDDLVTMSDCLHDMGDPVGAAAHLRRRLADDGTWLLVEPCARDRLEDNLNPAGRRASETPFNLVLEARP